MLKSISNLGSILNKDEQKTINGGQIQCPPNHILVCNWIGCWCKKLLAEEKPKEIR